MAPHENTLRNRAAASTDDSIKRRSAGVVSAKQTRIFEDDLRALHIEVEEHDFADVTAKKAFPISDKTEYISFLDKKEKEVAMLADPANLDEESAKALKRWMDRMYYAAHIEQVYSISEVMGVSYWQVRTDCGYAGLEIVDRTEHIRALPKGRYIITDADGNRFEIEDVGKLDKASQLLIETET